MLVESVSALLKWSESACALTREEAIVVEEQEPYQLSIGEVKTTIA
jgi:hypothetical protein